jgi:hypothetical protein
LGLSEDIVNKIINFRLGEDEIRGSADDNIFDTVSNIVPKLSQFYHFNDSEIAQLSVAVDRYLLTNSNNFMIRSIARLYNRNNSSEIIAIVNRSGKVLYWKES